MKKILIAITLVMISFTTACAQDGTQSSGAETDKIVDMADIIEGIASAETVPEDIEKILAALFIERINTTEDEGERRLHFKRGTDRVRFLPGGGPEFQEFCSDMPNAGEIEIKDGLISFECEKLIVYNASFQADVEVINPNGVDYGTESDGITHHFQLGEVLPIITFGKFYFITADNGRPFILGREEGYAAYKLMSVPFALKVMLEDDPITAQDSIGAMKTHVISHAIFRKIIRRYIKAKNAQRQMTVLFD